ncbi:DinB superfamily protein [Cohnella sp. OV330]|uniref:DinB family protein n=1 Tax=Cohnella sp. OV330 TaxID=1855288 RepID=UPI0008F0B987|nr:DinB family protein [Cohnella sp. OV330]SFB09251.1 DinB superfamily protein [Cohnella sp. OV330]
MTKTMTVREAEARLRGWIRELPPLLADRSEEALKVRPEPGRWSQLEILGHLCDSALHNLMRFVRIRIEPQPLPLTPYAQDDWVSGQRYQAASYDHVLSLWLALNTRIADVWAGLPEGGGEWTFLRPDGTTITLELWAEDYVLHLEHHLRAMNID